MCTKNEFDELLKIIADTYREVYGKKVVKILLYGSFARGDNNEFSDVDIVALINDDRKDIQAALKDVWEVSSELELKYDVIVSPTAIPIEEFEKYKNDLPYYKNINNEGVEIVA